MQDLDDAAAMLSALDTFDSFLFASSLITDTSFSLSHVPSFLEPLPSPLASHQHARNLTTLPGSAWDHGTENPSGSSRLVADDAWKQTSQQQYLYQQHQQYQPQHQQQEYQQQQQQQQQPQQYPQEHQHQHHHQQQLYQHHHERQQFDPQQHEGQYGHQEDPQRQQQQQQQQRSSQSLQHNASSGDHPANANQHLTGSAAASSVAAFNAADRQLLMQAHIDTACWSPPPDSTGTPADADAMQHFVMAAPPLLSAAMAASSSAPVSLAATGRQKSMSAHMEHLRTALHPSHQLFSRGAPSQYLNQQDAADRSAPLLVPYYQPLSHTLLPQQQEGSYARRDNDAPAAALPAYPASKHSGYGGRPAAAPLLASPFQQGNLPHMPVQYHLPDELLEAQIIHQGQILQPSAVQLPQHSGQGMYYDAQTETREQRLRAAEAAIAVSADVMAVAARQMAAAAAAAATAASERSATYQQHHYQAASCPPSAQGSAAASPGSAVEAHPIGYHDNNNSHNNPNHNNNNNNDSRQSDNSGGSVVALSQPPGPPMSFKSCAPPSHQHPPRPSAFAIPLLPQPQPPPASSQRVVVSADTAINHLSALPMGQMEAAVHLAARNEAAGLVAAPLAGHAEPAKQRRAGRAARRGTEGPASSTAPQPPASNARRRSHVTALAATSSTSDDKAAVDAAREIVSRSMASATTVPTSAGGDGGGARAAGRAAEPAEYQQQQYAAAGLKRPPPKLEPAPPAPPVGTGENATEEWVALLSRRQVADQLARLANIFVEKKEELEELQRDNEALKGRERVLSMVNDVRKEQIERLQKPLSNEMLYNAVDNMSRELPCHQEILSSIMEKGWNLDGPEWLTVYGCLVDAISQCLLSKDKTSVVAERVLSVMASIKSVYQEVFVRSMTNFLKMCTLSAEGGAVPPPDDALWLLQCQSINLSPQQVEDVSHLYALYCAWSGEILRQRRQLSEALAITIPDSSTSSGPCQLVRADSNPDEAVQALYRNVMQERCLLSLVDEVLVYRIINPVQCAMMLVISYPHPGDIAMCLHAIASYHKGLRYEDATRSEAAEASLMKAMQAASLCDA